MELSVDPAGVLVTVKPTTSAGMSSVAVTPAAGSPADSISVIV